MMPQPPAHASRLFEPLIDLPQRRSNARTLRATSDSTDDDAEPPREDHSFNQSGADDLPRPLDFPIAPLKYAFDLPQLHNQRNAVPQGNLKHQHFAVLNAILHKSLLAGDYARASHAFGILLRYDVHGHRPDLRRKALWGIGAEILLHSQAVNTLDFSAALQQGTSQWFSDEGFTATKQFYDRLILQYPFRKTVPEAVSELHFYPAMLGLWVFQVQSRYAHLRTSAGVHNMAETGDRRLSQSLDAGRESALENQINDIQSIIDVVESKTRFPPFDQHIGMLRLQADLLNWQVSVVSQTRSQQGREDELQRAAARVGDQILRVEASEEVE